MSLCPNLLLDCAWPTSHILRTCLCHLSLLPLHQFFLCLLISSSSSTNIVTSLFLVPSALKTSNNLSIGSVLIYSSFTSYLLILVWVHPKLTSTLNHNFFLFDIWTFVHILSFFSLLSFHCGITYQLRNLLYTEVCHTISTPNLQQNSSLYYYLFHLILLVCFCSLSSVLICNSLQGILFCCTYSIS